VESFIIGVFDSGLGGLTVVKEIKKLLPNVSLVYLGDTARVPYGTRSKETIEKFAKEDTLFLLSKNVSCIVVACNTVSSLALDIVKKNSNVPVFGVIDPAINKALEVTKSGRIGIVGTRATINSNSYKEASIRAHASMLVPLIEEGFIEGPEINLFIDKYFLIFKEKIDTLILGCTHYPLIKSQIKKYLGEKIKLVDPAEEVSKVIYDYIIKLNRNINDKESSDIYFLTDVNERFVKTAELFLGQDISKKIRKVNL
jgi:glutamate racemase